MMSYHRRSLNNGNPPRDEDIPGYYFDENTRRYFRNVPAGTPVPQILSGGAQGSSKEPIQPKNQPLMKLHNVLMKRQVDGKSPSFQKEILIAKTTNLKKTGALDFTVTHCPNFKEVVFLKGAPYSLLVEFNVQELVPLVNGSSVTEVYHPFTPVAKRQSRFSNFVVNNNISVNDICVGFNNSKFLMFVGNNFRSKMGITQIVSRSLDRRDIMFRNFTCIYPIWCCSSNNVTEKFAHGSQSAFSIVDVTGQWNSTKQKGNVHGITFNEAGNVIYSALHNGKIAINDLRSPNSATYKKIDQIGLDEAVLTKDENYLICGGFDGFLCKVDLRTNQKLLEYKGHVHTPCKVPFSFSETHDLLCATGCDNVTRLWSLSHGNEPLNSILPETEGALCRSCLITDGRKVSVCVTQKQKALLYDIFA